MNRSLAGRRGEDRAAVILESKGMHIVARNVRSRVGEVDLVALDGETLVFVEVKAWSRYGRESLEWAIDRRKQKRIIETAQFFLAANRQYNGMAIRFDVVFIGSAENWHLAEAFTECV
jgi:putative endonuclease